MSFSNRHSFHFKSVLQNATALPKHIYRSANNWICINHRAAAVSYVSLQDGGMSRTTPAERHFASGKTTVTQEAYIPSPFPEGRDPVTIVGQASRKASSPSPTPPVIKDVVPTKAKHPKRPPMGDPPTVNAEEERSPDPSIPRYSPMESRKPCGHSAPTVCSTTQPPTKTAVAAQPKHYRQPTDRSKKPCWKPGHGIVEKVDKLTGEIVHLSEEWG